MSDQTASPEPTAPEVLRADAAAGTDAAASAPVSPDTRRWTSLSNPFAVGFSLTLGGLVAILLGLAVSNLSTILIYIAFALFAALGLNPVVSRLERAGLSRVWAIVLVYAAFALVIVGVLWLIMPTVVSQIAQFIGDIPSMIRDFEQTDAYAWMVTTFGDQVDTIVSQLQSFITNPANIAAIGGGVLQVGVSIATTISGLIIVLVLSLYFLASLQPMKDSFVRFAPARSRAKVAGMTDEITESVGGYLMGMVVLAFCNSVVAFLLHFFLGLPFPALMAVVAFCITLIP
ncbi:AI-2E family transporter, partial [Microbacterium fluvii]